MKRTLTILPLLLVVITAIFSCQDGGKSYEELKSEEMKIIKDFIAKEGIEVLKTYPANGVFGSKQFVELPTGIYLNVVDSGNGNRAVLGKTTILIRCSGKFLHADTVYPFNTFDNALTTFTVDGTTFDQFTYPIEFKYGYASTVVSQHSSSGDLEYFLLGTGIESILNYVGDSAIVRLIVPAYAEINNYSIASSSFQSSSDAYIPIYYDKLRYVFK